MKNNFMRWGMIALVIVILPVSAFAELKFSEGASFRLRYEYWKNLKDMDNDQLDNRNFFRLRSSVWGQAEYNKNLTLFAKLTNEFKPYVYYAPSSSKASGKTDKAYHFELNEFVWDNLYLDCRTAAGLPVDLRLGRQDLNTYGEGFLIQEGTPGDGTRTFYFNAFKAAWRINDKNNLEFIYINDPRDDVFLPVINEQKPVQSLNTTDEEGYVLYWKNQARKNLAVEGYYLYKREGGDGGTGAQAEKGILNTFGSFVKYDFSAYTLRAQLARQFGSYGTQDRFGLGGYAYLDREFKDALWSPKATLGYIYLSGDRKRTDKNEGWDPLFSRHTWISDIYATAISAETGISYYWTNLGVVRAGLVLKPTKKVKITSGYCFLRANEQVAAGAIFSGTGKTRGHLPQAKVEYAFNKNASAYFLAEYLIPGNFYKDRDPALFLRTELQIKF